MNKQQYEDDEEKKECSIHGTMIDTTLPIDKVTETTIADGNRVRLSFEDLMNMMWNASINFFTLQCRRSPVLHTEQMTLHTSFRSHHPVQWERL